MSSTSQASTRRIFVVGGAVALAATALGGGYYAWTMRRPFEGATLDPAEAHDLAVAGEIFLVDIRQPGEWQATGVGEGAIPLDMRRADFAARLSEITSDAPDRPIALICARGVRSSQLTARLKADGMDDLLDVPEGMLGSRAGPGWIARGLPVVAPDRVVPAA